MKKQISLLSVLLLLLLAGIYHPVFAQIPNIVKAEYFLDTDPGFGQGTNIPVTPASNIATLNFNVPIGNLTAGFHNLFVRAKDTNGKWSITQVRSFYKESAPAALPNIVKAEYFIDTDPGYNAGTNIPLTPATDIQNLQFAVNISALPLGAHKLFVRAKDAAGKWSITSVRQFNVCNGPAAPTVTAASRCDQGTVTLSASGGNAGDYRWFTSATNATPISGATGATFITPSLTTTTTYFVAIANGSCESPRIPVIATVNPKPATPVIVQNGSTLTSSSATGNQWFLNSTLIPGATAQTYATTSNGNYTVIVTTNGCSSDASAVTSVTNTGINSALVGMSVQIYPNPAKGSFNVKLNGYQKDATVVIYNLAGQQITARKAAADGKPQHISLKGLAAGTYLLKVISDKGVSISRLMVQ